MAEYQKYELIDKTNRGMHAIIKNDNKYHYRILKLALYIQGKHLIQMLTNKKKKDAINYNVASKITNSSQNHSPGK